MFGYAQVGNGSWPCKNAKTLNRGRRSYSSKTALVALLASKLNLEIELRNIILVAFRFFEFLHSQGKTRTSSLGAARPLPPSADIGPGGQVNLRNSALGAPRPTAALKSKLAACSAQLSSVGIDRGMFPERKGLPEWAIASKENRCAPTASLRTPETLRNAAPQGHSGILRAGKWHRSKNTPDNAPEVRFRSSVPRGAPSHRRALVSQVASGGRRSFRSMSQTSRSFGARDIRQTRCGPLLTRGPESPRDRLAQFKRIPGGFKSPCLRAAEATNILITPEGLLCGDLGEHGEVLRSAKWCQISEIGGAQIGTTFECLCHACLRWLKPPCERIAGCGNAYCQQGSRIVAH